MLVMSACLFILYYNSRSVNNNAYPEQHGKIDLRNNAIIYSDNITERLDSGNWHLNKWKMYHTLSFENENILMIANHVDTLFRYKYKLNNDTLWLMVKEKTSVPNKIKLHNNEELIFEGFVDEKKELRYTRTNNLKK